MPPKRAQTVDDTKKAKPKVEPLKGKKAKEEQQKKADVQEKQPEKKEQKTQKQQKLPVVDKQGEKVIAEGGQKKSELGDGKFASNIVKIASWNINGIRASTKHQSTVDYLSAGKFDIICLNELKADEAAFDKEGLGAKLPKDYFANVNFCKIKPGYSGVAILSKVKPISVKFDLGIPKHDEEGRTITAEFEKFNLVSCYVPNSGEKLDRLSYRTKQWDVDFQNYLEELRKKKPTILCGDLNVAHHEIDLANPAGNKKTAGFTQEERDQFTNYLQKGWVDSFRSLHPKEVKYSYFSARQNARQNNKGWRLDYFVINQEAAKAITVSDINTAVEGSDHVPIECEVDLSKL